MSRAGLTTLAALAMFAVFGAGAAAETRRVLVVPVVLAGDAPVVDKAQIVEALFGATNSVAAHYRAVSYGAVDFAGSAADVADPVHVDTPNSLCGAGLGHLADEARSQVANRGVDLGLYRHFVFLLPPDTPCGWIGLGDIGGNRVWAKAATTNLLQHELGHNLGMNHALRWGARGPDASDFMGSDAPTLNAPHVLQMGWLDAYPGKTIKIADDADVTLEALEADPLTSSTPKIALVSQGPGANAYVLSYRTTGASEFLGGVNVHIFNRETGEPTLTAFRNAGQSFFVRALVDGETYEDGPLRIEQISHAPGLVHLRIRFDGAGLPRPIGPPPAPPGALQSLASGKCVDLPGANTQDHVEPVQWDCHGAPNQQWDLEPWSGSRYRLISKLSGKCLGIVKGAAAGRSVQQSECINTDEQLWERNVSREGYTLANASDGLCLDVERGSLNNGARLVAWPCHGGANETWRYAEGAEQ